MTIRLIALIPSYNGGQYLRKSVESLLNQTRPPERIIVIDDASTDGSITTILDLETAGEIEIRRNPRNLGKAESLNRCFAELQADYFLIQDADDIALPHRVERQVAFMEADPELGCSSGFIEYINRTGKRVGMGRLDLLTRERLAEYLAGDEPFGLFCPAAIIRGSVVADPAFRFRGQFWPADDIDLWNRIAEGGWGVLAQPEALVQYRIHGSSAVTSSFMRTRMQFEWVRDSLRARRRGSPEPDKETFLKCWNRQSLVTRINRSRKLHAKAMYRKAGFSVAEKHWCIAIVQLGTALVLQPEYVFSRAISQWSKSVPEK